MSTQVNIFTYTVRVQAAANARLVGAQIAHLLEVLYDVKGISTISVHIIGHSLGAHIAGYAGKRLSRKNFTLGRISGIMGMTDFK